MKNIFKIIIKISMLMCITIASYGFLKQVFKNTDVSTNEMFKSLEDDSIDVFVLGSSQAQYSFSPSIFYRDTGLYSYNLGSQCQQPEVSYQMLKEALKTQKPDLVILEIFTFMPLRDICKDEGCYVVAAYQMTGQERLDTLSYISGETAEQYYSDFISLHNNWRKYSLNEFYERIKNVFLKPEDKEINDENFGYVYMDGNYEEPSNSWYPSTFKEYDDIELEAIHLEALNNIYNLCEENDIKLMLYKTPMDSIDVENYSYIKKIWKWADEHNVEYYDFLTNSKENGLEINIHSDSFHSNVTGACLMTRRLAEIIKEEGYSFEHKEIDRLSDLYKKGSENLLSTYLIFENNQNLFLDQFENNSGYIAVRYNPKNGGISDRAYKKLIGLGFEDFDRNDSYVAVLHDNGLIDSDGENVEVRVNGFNAKISLDRIEIDDNNYETDNACEFIFINENNGSFAVKEIK